MANRYWVGGTGSWTSVNTANWSTTSGGVGGASVPTSADTIYIDSNSGSGLVSLDTTVNGKDFYYTNSNIGLTTLNTSTQFNIFGHFSISVVPYNGNCQWLNVVLLASAVSTFTCVPSLGNVTFSVVVNPLYGLLTNINCKILSLSAGSGSCTFNLNTRTIYCSACSFGGSTSSLINGTIIVTPESSGTAFLGPETMSNNSDPGRLSVVIEDSIYPTTVYLAATSSSNSIYNLTLNTIQAVCTLRFGYLNNFICSDQSKFATWATGDSPPGNAALTLYGNLNVTGTTTHNSGDIYFRSLTPSTQKNRTINVGTNSIFSGLFSIGRVGDTSNIDIYNISGSARFSYLTLLRYTNLNNSEITIRNEFSVSSSVTTFNAGTSTIIFNPEFGEALFSSGSRTFNNIKIEVPKTLTFQNMSGIITINTLSCTNALGAGGSATINLDPNYAYNVTQFILSGASNSDRVALTRNGVSGATSIVQVNGSVVAYNADISNSTTSGGAVFFAPTFSGYNNTDGGGNTGWIFDSIPSSGGFFAFF